MEKRTVSEIDAEIEATKKELEHVRGTETEVYARIVGYYRAVRNWNKGKRDEFSNRVLFECNSGNAKKRAAKTEEHRVKNIEAECAPVKSENMSAYSYELFLRETCPNCPPVKNYMKNSALDGKFISVDNDDGLQEAAAKGVFSAPTVIFYDKNGDEIGRGHSVKEIESILLPAAITA